MPVSKWLWTAVRVPISRPSALRRKNPGLDRGPAIRAAALTLCAVVATAAAGCGETEKSGAVGDTLSAKGLEVTLEAVDTAVPVPANDVTGLSRPAPGSKLVGIRVRVCSDHRGAIGPFDFGVETTSGESGRLKYPATNYPKPFERLRRDCGGGWVVFEIPARSEPERVSFGFEDTGTAFEQQNVVDARFSWALT